MIYVVYETDFWDYQTTGNGDRYFLRLVTSDSAQADRASVALFADRWEGHAIFTRNVRDVPPLGRIMTFDEIEALPR